MLRKARTSDVRIIQQILNHYASQGKLLPRSLSELYTHLRDTFVWVDEETGQVVGGGSPLPPCTEDHVAVGGLIRHTHSPFVCFEPQRARSVQKNPKIHPCLLG